MVASLVPRLVNGIRPLKANKDVVETFGAFLISRKVELFFEHEDTSVLDVDIAMNKALNDEEQDMVHVAISYSKNLL